MRLQDLKPGMRVQTNNNPAPNLHYKVGTIIWINASYVVVRLDYPIYSRTEWSFYAGWLDLVDPQEIERLEDQKKREAHALKYL